LPNSPLFFLRASGIKFLRGVIVLVLFAGLQFAAPVGLFAQQPSPSPSPEPMDVVVNLGHGEELTLSSEQGGSEQKIVPTVTLTPNQAVAITLQFGTHRAGAPVMVGTYDGGQISGLDGMTFVPPDGAVPFNFQPGGGLGTYRVLVLVGAEQHLLQFSVMAPGQ
jgi:hypothetical protein